MGASGLWVCPLGDWEAGRPPMGVWPVGLWLMLGVWVEPGACISPSADWISCFFFKEEIVKLTDASSISARADDDTNMEQLGLRVDSSLSAESHASAQTFESEGSDLTGVLVEVGKDGEEITDFGVESASSGWVSFLFLGKSRATYGWSGWPGSTSAWVNLMCTSPPILTS